MKQKAPTDSQKKIVEVMHEFAAGELHAGKTQTVVSNRKQAIAIAISEADELLSKPKK